MESTETIVTAHRNVVRPGPGSGFTLGLFGYLVALVAFGSEGLFVGGEDAGD